MNNDGFLASLFDLSFSHFITLKLIKVIFVLSLLWAGVVALMVVASGFQAGLVYGVLALLIGAPLVFLIIVMASRIWLEIAAVIFRGAEHLREIESNTRGARHQEPSAF